MTKIDPTKSPPVTVLDGTMAFVYAVALAMRQARLNGLLTEEVETAISDRIEVLHDAMLEGKILDVSAEGEVTIREATPEDKAALEADDQATTISPKILEI